MIWKKTRPIKKGLFYNHGMTSEMYRRREEAELSFPTTLRNAKMAMERACTLLARVWAALVVVMAPLVHAQDVNALIIRTSITGQPCGGALNVKCDGGFERRMTTNFLASNVSLTCAYCVHFANRNSAPPFPQTALT